MSTKTCAECKFHKDSGSEGWGYCKRYAPGATTVTPSFFDTHVSWPKTKDDDWCGEFEQDSGLL